MKIFVTVGTQFSFDRLIAEVDAWCAARDDIRVIAQIGKAKYIPKNMEYYEMLDSSDFNRLFNESDLIIAHAGMGIILKALVNNKPLLVLPRKLDLNEHNTDHQMATAITLERLGYVNVAWDNGQLREYLVDPTQIRSRKTIKNFASVELISGLREFIENT